MKQKIKAKWIAVLILMTLFLSSSRVTYAQDGMMDDAFNVDALTQWDYQWGDSPRLADGTPAWLEADSAGWQSTQTLVTPPGRQDEHHLWLRTPLPERSHEPPLRDPALYLPLVNDAVEVYLDDVLIHRFGEFYESGEVEMSGSSLHLLSLPSDYPGKTLTLRIYAQAGSIAATHLQMPDIGLPHGAYLGNRGDHLAFIFRRDIGDFTLGSLFLLLSLVPLALFAANFHQRTYLLLGLFMIGAGLCVWLDTQLRYLVFPYPVFWAWAPAIAINLMLIGLIAFFEDIFGAGYQSLLRRLWQFHVVYALIPPLSAILPLSVLGIAELLILAGLAIYRLVQKNVEAGIFVLGFAVFAPFMALDGLLSLGLLPYSIFLFHLGMLLLIIALSLILVRRFALVYQQLGKSNLAMSRFVPMHFLNYLGRESVTDIQLGDQTQKDMTILFADIRSFTELSEKMTPEENFRFLNAYLGRVSPLIRENDGFIDKYIGDAIMALFPNGPDDALRAAIAMQKAVALYNESDRIPYGREAIRIGIGIHTGTMMLGTIGEAQRMESTVISDAVNLASRIEGLTKLYGVGIIVSEQILTSLNKRSEFEYRFLDRVKVKGKQEVVKIFDVLGGDAPVMHQLKARTKGDFERAVQLYCEGHFEDAKVYIDHVLFQNPEDVSAQFYRQRINRLLETGPPESWNGVLNLTEK